jgi:CRISPR system Cascade subunit CasC
MTTYLQFHTLKTLSPSNLNRGEDGKFKTALFGGKKRLRISSQSLKRSYRTSVIFTDALDVSSRTRSLGMRAYDTLCDAYEDKPLVESIAYANLVLEKTTKRVAPGKGTKWSMPKSVIKEIQKTLQRFEGSEGKTALRTSQVLALHNYQVSGYLTAVKYLCESGIPTTYEDAYMVEHLIHIGDDPVTAIDIALNGRMYTSASEHSVGGAALVAHGISVDEVKDELDFFAAVDDFNRDDETGSAHQGPKAFASGTMYFYYAINLDLLIKNLEGNLEHARKGVKALAKVMAIVNPTGNQTTFASQSLADYVRVEATSSPCSLTSAFEVPVRPTSEGILKPAIVKLEETAEQYCTAYEGLISYEHTVFNRFRGHKFTEVLQFIDSVFDKLESK